MGLPIKRAALLLVSLAVVGLGLSRGSAPWARPAADAPAEPTAAPLPPPPPVAAVVHPPAPSSSEGEGALPAPPPSGSIRLTVGNRELYDEMQSVVAYYKTKRLPDRGPVHSVGDGVDSSDRAAKLPPDTPFSRFRYEYEKHDSARLMSDLTWADAQLAGLRYEERLAQGTLSEAERAEGDLLLRRRRAIVSILDARARDERLHDRYQRVEVVLDEGGDPRGNHGG